MVANVAGERRCQRDVAEIAEQADGVPLFVEELTKAVLELVRRRRRRCPRCRIRRCRSLRPCMLR